MQSNTFKAQITTCMTSFPLDVKTTPDATLTIIHRQLPYHTHREKKSRSKDDQIR